MGYDSTFSGALHPNKPIPEELVKIINGVDRDVRVQPSDYCDDFDGDPGDIVPSARNMHGYNLAEDVFRITRLLSEHGIKLSGELYRSGEDPTDHERVTVRSGRVYTAQASFVYRNRKEVTSADITHYYVRVSREVPGKPDRFIGWLVKGVCDERARIVRCAKKHDKLPAPLTVTRFDTEQDARDAVKTIDAEQDVVFSIISYEDPL